MEVILQAILQRSVKYCCKYFFNCIIYSWQKNHNNAKRFFLMMDKFIQIISNPTTFMMWSIALILLQPICADSIFYPVRFYIHSSNKRTSSLLC